MLPSAPTLCAPNADLQIIRITTAHLAAGQPTSHTYCPIAIAITERNPAYNVIVGANRISLTLNNERIALTMSVLVQTWVCDYDNRKSMGPITIQLDFRQRLVHLAIDNKNGEPTYA